MEDMCMQYNNLLVTLLAGPSDGNEGVIKKCMNSNSHTLHK